MADIFISYSKAYRGLTQDLAQDLQERGFSVWWDSDLLSGERFRDVILSELAQARAAIVIWTSASVKSDWVCSEASRAQASGILIPARDTDIEVHDIPPPFDVLYTDLVSDRPALYAALARLGVAPSATAQPTPVVSPLALVDAAVTEPADAADPEAVALERREVTATVRVTEANYRGFALIDLGRNVGQGPIRLSFRRQDADPRHLGKEGWQREIAWHAADRVAGSGSSTAVRVGPAVVDWIDELVPVEIVVEGEGSLGTIVWPALAKSRRHLADPRPASTPTLAAREGPRRPSVLGRAGPQPVPVSDSHPQSAAEIANARERKPAPAVAKQSVPAGLGGDEFDELLAVGIRQSARSARPMPTKTEARAPADAKRRGAPLPLWAGAGVLALILFGGLAIAFSNAGREFSCRTLGVLCAKVAALPDTCAAAETHWRSAEAIGTLAAFEDHLARFPNCAFAGLARAKIEELKRKMVAVPPPAPPAAPCGGATLASLSSRAAKPLSAGEECALKPKDVFKECETCPEMVVVPAGSFTMGSPTSEEGRDDREGPQHRVTISRSFAVGRLTVTLDQFSAFVTETGFDADSSCYAWEKHKWAEKKHRSWRNPGFSQNGTHPAVCLNWNDAKAYAAWLWRKTGKAYRLLTEAEWEYAARAGSTTRYYFGDDEKDFCRYGNGADLTANKRFRWTGVLPCNDGYLYTAPAGSFLPNAFALYDMHGNATQWVEDCYQDSYKEAPSDGSAKTTGDCIFHVLRGGSWLRLPRHLRSPVRYTSSSRIRLYDYGVRVGRTVTP